MFKLPVSGTVLEDGTSLSIQASSNHYCSPRSDNYSLYEEYEVGFVEDANKKTIPLTGASQYRDTGDHDIYAYVPVRIILAFIKAHGGVKKS
jgi:hypothetical protein